MRRRTREEVSKSQGHEEDVCFFPFPGEILNNDDGSKTGAGSTGGKILEKITAAPCQCFVSRFCLRLAGRTCSCLTYRQQGYLLAQVNNFVKIAAVKFGNRSVLRYLIIIDPRPIEPENQRLKDFFFQRDRENGHAVIILKTDDNLIFFQDLPAMD